jgi:tetratricopeptide (TPR) repeat protein
MRDLLERRGDLGSPEELAASEGLGEALWLAGRAPKARAVLSELAARCRDRGVLERLQRKIGETHFHEGTFGEATESYWRAVAALGEWRPRSALGMVLLGLRELGRYLALCLVPAPWRHPSTGEPTKADGLSATYFRLAQCYYWSRPVLYVVPMLRSINLGWRSTALEDRALAYSLSAMFWSSTLMRRARRDVARAVALANRIAPSKIGGVMRVCTAIALWHTGAWPEAEQESLEARRIYQKIGAITELGTASIMRWVCLGGRGLMRDALECAESALPGLRSSSANQFIKVTHYMRARALAKLGETEAALEEGHIAVELGEKTQDQLATAMALIELGDAYLTAGRLTEADEWLTRACASPLPLFMLFDWTCRAFPLLARARFEAWQQDPASRERHRQCARALRAAVLVGWLRPNQRPDVWTVRGTWRWQHGRRRAAERDFARAIARAQGFTSLIQEADAYYAWGRCTLASSPERAREHLQRARDVYATCGIVPYERRAAVLLESVGRVA